MSCESRRCRGKRSHQHQTFEGDVDHTRTLAQEASRLAPKDLDVQQVACHIALAAKEELDTLAIGRCAEALRNLAPDDPYTWYVGALEAGFAGELHTSQERLDRAHALGLPDDAYDSLHASLVDAQPWYVRWAWPALAGYIALYFPAAVLLLRRLDRLRSVTFVLEESCQAVADLSEESLPDLREADEEKPADGHRHERAGYPDAWEVENVRPTEVGQFDEPNDTYRDDVGDRDKDRGPAAVEG